MKINFSYKNLEHCINLPANNSQSVHSYIIFFIDNSLLLSKIIKTEKVLPYVVCRDQPCRDGCNVVGGVGGDSR